ncbi:hypothetical protein AB4090_05700 [Acidithiobacillus sp. IBUN Pt1247-S3]|uniref:hypothetical protein n=1 Tax=Acidithiobacillus sp. IBUN Pt1247-S3 TaxID=3166642 RepID=UPI0034E59F13
MGKPDPQGDTLIGDAIVEYLLYLRESAGAIALSDLGHGIHSIGRVVRLSPTGVTISCQDLGGSDIKLLVAHYEPSRSVHFLLQDGKEADPGFWVFPYPGSIQVRQERRNLRYTLNNAVLACWHSPCSTELVRGDVVDIGLGGFLASIYVSSEQLADTGGCEEGDQGVVVLRRDDLREWRGQAELRRRVLLDPPSDEKKGKHTPEFVLLGFAFQFADRQAMNELTDFFQGILGPIA